MFVSQISNRTIINKIRKRSKINMFCIKFMKNIFRYFCLLFTVSTIIIYSMINMKSSDIDEFWRDPDKYKIKHILLWSKHADPEWSKLLRKGDNSFRDLKCKYDNCFVTDDDKLLPSVAMFDAILFDGVEISESEAESESYELPQVRHPKQLYIFSSKQSAANYPVCNHIYDKFFNLTWTYKLNSDIHWPYFNVFDHDNKEIGPRINMTWATKYLAAPGEYDLLVQEKELTAIWIASNCNTNSRREMLVNNLRYALRKKKQYLETIGNCGLKQCPENMEADCLKQMYKFFFYFAFENSLADDFITDNVLKAFKNYLVPIVYGDADYSRFLPPHSYINIAKLGVNKTLQIMEFLMDNKRAYLEYFRWKNHYVLEPTNQFVCKVCEALNTGIEKVYTDFRKWWNPISNKAYGRSISPSICKEPKS